MDVRSRDPALEGVCLVTRPIYTRSLKSDFTPVSTKTPGFISNLAPSLLSDSASRCVSWFLQQSASTFNWPRPLYRPPWCYKDNSSAHPFLMPVAPFPSLHLAALCVAYLCLRPGVCLCHLLSQKTRTQANTNQYGTEASAAGPNRRPLHTHICATSQHIR